MGSSGGIREVAQRAEAGTTRLQAQDDRAAVSLRPGTPELDVDDEAIWLLDLLWSAGLKVVWTAAGRLPAGYRPAERLLLLPSGPGRTFTLTVGPRRGMYGCVTAYGGLRPLRRRAARAAVGLGLLAGVGERIGALIEIGVPEAAPPSAQPHLLSSHLAQLFGERHVVVGCSAGFGPYRKPVLQVFDDSGRPLGYAKVGWNAWTREAVRREAEGLRRLAAQAGVETPLSVPSLVSQHSWNGLDLVVSAPLPRGVRRVADGSSLPSVAVLKCLAEASPVEARPLAASTWWCELRHRVGRLPADPVQRQLTEILDLTEEGAGESELAFAMAHGDLSPWNLAVGGGRTYAWDFESSSPSAPLGIDAIHFHFQSSFVAAGRDVADAATYARNRASGALSSLGVPPSRHALVSHLHLLDLAARHEEARACTGASDARFAAAMLAVLAGSTPRRGGSLLQGKPA
jgi:hypothetical protein